MNKQFVSKSLEGLIDEIAFVKCRGACLCYGCVKRLA